MKAWTQVTETTSYKSLSFSLAMILFCDPVPTKKPKGSTKHLSAQIQNEFMQLIPKHLQREFPQEIKVPPFYSLIRDTLQDIPRINRISELFFLR